MRLHRIIVVTALVCGLAAPAFADAVLKVNTVEITSGQLAIAKYKVTRDSDSLAGNDGAATKAAVDMLVADVLLSDAAREAGISLSDKDVKKAIAALQERLGGKSAVKDGLAKLGATEDELKAVGSRHMLAQRYVAAKVAPTVTVTEAEAKAYYEQPENQIQHSAQLNLRMIFVNAPPGISEKDDAKAKARIEEAERRIVAGEEFGAVARDLSDDMSKEKGGELGWMGLQAIPPQYLGKVWAVEPGATSDVVRGKFGYVLVQVVAKRERGVTPFDDVRDQVMAQLTKSKVDSAAAAVVATRRGTAKVEGLTPETAAAVKP
jgi:parvulin-like peptidyl-prolyl isomerase